MRLNEYKVIILPGAEKTTDDEEKFVAKLLTEFFQCDIYIQPTANTINKADFLIRNVEWELKTIEKIGKYTIKHRMAKAKKQSSRIIFNFRHINNTSNALSKLKHELSFHNNNIVKEVLYIDKKNKIRRLR